MRSTPGSARSVLTRAPTATYVVKFERRPRGGPRAEEPDAVGRIPRVARLLAFAHRIDRMIRSGELRDWADAARMAGVTRARMTQIAHMLLLAPEIQQAILRLPATVEGREPVTEHDVRPVEARIEWELQRCAWEKLLVRCRS